MPAHPHRSELTPAVTVDHAQPPSDIAPPAVTSRLKPGSDPVRGLHTEKDPDDETDQPLRPLDPLKQGGDKDRSIHGPSLDEPSSGETTRGLLGAQEGHR